MSITTISISELPEKLKEHYYKWAAITKLNNLDAYFENALAVGVSTKTYKCFHLENSCFFVKDTFEYSWLFFYDGGFAFSFDEFEKLVNNTYENIKD